MIDWLFLFTRQLSGLQVGWTDLLDVLSVTVLIYALLVLIRGSRAMQMLYGILLFSALWLGAEALKLMTLSRILSELLFYLPFAIVVLFQHEIRSMLSAFGSTGLSRFFGGSSEGPVMVNDLTLAVQSLASKRTGALIAIERRDSLGTWIDTGIPLEARLSYDLLLNIFITGTPLHDGAVIVRGERIAAAACFLPLTTRAELSTELGTRHRAAIGLSEESDALVIAVSEETGTISLAVQGQLLRPLDDVTLRDALIENLYQMRSTEETSA